MTLVKIGSSYYNLEQVTEIRDTGVDIEIFFATDKASILRGADADQFRRWLDENCTNLNSNSDLD